MRIVAISDLHGEVNIDIPQADMLLIGGDITPSRDINQSSNWFKNYFKPWLDKLPVKHIVAVAGNHDSIFTSGKKLLPKLKWKYLEDKTCKTEGISIFGSPWTITFCNWYFMKSDIDLAQNWKLIPEGIDILLLHGPPQGCADLSNPRYGFVNHVGSTSLLKAILEKKPRLVVFGHIHDGHGIYEADKNSTLGNIQFNKIETDILKIPKQSDKIYFVNASLLNDDYQMVFKPTIIELD
jgi:Icc-related predicted phosphoesterase